MVPENSNEPDRFRKGTSMSKWLIAMMAALAVGSAAYADDNQGNNNNQGDDNQGQNTPTAAPEIDPGTALSGLTLLAGGLAVIRGRKVRK